MKKSMSNVVAGGLITSATVMGVDAALNPAEAAIMESRQEADFSFTLNNDAMTCCVGLATNSNTVTFDPFDTDLGDLISAVLGVTIGGITNATAPDALTCCFDLTDVTDYGGQIAGQDLTEAFVRELGNNANTATIELDQLGKELNTAILDFNILFEENSVFPIIDEPQGGKVFLSYFYEPTAVPIPGSAALLLPSLIGLYGMAGAARRRRKEDA